MTFKPEWDFDVPPPQVNLERIHKELLRRDIFSRATYVLELERNAPQTFALYRDKYLGGKESWGR